MFLSFPNLLMVACYWETGLWCETPVLPVNKGNIKLLYYLGRQINIRSSQACEGLGVKRGISEHTPHQLELKSSQMCKWLFGEIYLRAERHKQQAFYIIQLWLHSDSQWWAVDYRGGGRRSFPPFSMWICPAPINPPPPPLVQSQWRSRGRRSESSRRLTGYAFHVGFRFRHHRQMVFHKDQVTQRMLAS